MANFGQTGGIFLILVALFVSASIFVRGFFSPINLANVMRQIAVVTIIALGATFVIILGHINVAYGSEVALIGCVACQIMLASKSLPLTIFAVLVMGVATGAITGFFITFFNIPAFVMTLALTTIARGGVLLDTSAIPVTGMAASFDFLGQGNLGILPMPVLILIVLFIICWILLSKTAFGRHLYAVGGNKNAAIASGVKANKVVMKAFLLDGTLTAIAGLILMSRMASGQPASGVGYEFDAITAVVVGGTSLAGGTGSIIGTIIGSVLVGILNNVLDLVNVNTYIQQIMKGVIILIAVIIDMMTKKDKR
jgi:inositol transport system permease protein